MNRRQRSRAATIGAYLIGLGVVAWEAVHGHWATVAWYFGGLVMLVALVVLVAVWIDRGDDS